MQFLSPSMPLHTENSTTRVNHTKKIKLSTSSV
uniref:Uncharacterized protein n=1 Tax=Arundo donax TaxID=35708 RepID=A0A0A9DYF7_ARUDO